MPLYEFECRDCGEVTEVLLINSADRPLCRACGGGDLQKVLSTPSSASGVSRTSAPGPGDTACCGSTPGSAAGCGGPGSCCGKPF